MAEVTPSEALERLREGNRRFAAGRCEHGSCDEWRRRGLVAGQSPFAVVLGCSDSRVPAEVVFDQGLGDLFVVRVAGNIAGPTQVASVEFAAERFGTRVIVVLGHTRCGAVAAALEALDRGGDAHTSEPGPIIGRILPVVETLPASGAGVEARSRAAERANIDASVARLRDDSPVLRALRETDGLLVVGAVYSLESGLVEFLEAPE